MHFYTLYMWLCVGTFTADHSLGIEDFVSAESTEEIMVNTPHDQSAGKFITDHSLREEDSTCPDASPECTGTEGFMVSATPQSVST